MVVFFETHNGAMKYIMYILYNLYFSYYTLQNYSAVLNLMFITAKCVIAYLKEYA